MLPTAVPEGGWGQGYEPPAEEVAVSVGAALAGDRGWETRGQPSVARSGNWGFIGTKKVFTGRERFLTLPQPKPK